VIPVVVISLRRSSDRRRAIASDLARSGISFSFFDAVDATAMSAAEVAELAPRPYVGHKDRILSRGEIAVSASFRRVLQQFCAGQDAFICIAEDDASFLPAAARYLEPDMLRGLPEFDVLRLVNDPPRERGLTRVVAADGECAIHAPLRLGFFMLAQIFSRDGAQKVIAGMVPLHAPLDNLVYRDAAIRGLRVLEIRPAVVVPHQGHSTQSTLATSYDQALPRGIWRSSAVAMRRKLFLLARRCRAVRSYVDAWGLSALLRLRPR
jgi:GR25 family glycosyltransferase involved in LPS biosynthesis